MLEESKEIEYIESEIFFYTKLIERDSSRLKYNDSEQFQKDMSRCIEINKERLATLESIKAKLQAFDLIKNSVNVVFDDTSKEIMLESKNDDLEYVFILNSDTLGTRLYDEQYESMKKTLK